MSKVCLEAEAAMFHRVMFDDLRHLTPRPTPTVQTAAIAAVNASFQQDAAAIMTLTITGRYARPGRISRDEFTVTQCRYTISIPWLGLLQVGWGLGTRLGQDVHILPLLNL